MAGRSNKSKNGNKKHDRNTKWCEAYRKRGSRERNKLRVLRKHLVRFPKDQCAVRARERCIAAIGSVRIAAQ